MDLARRRYKSQTKQDEFILSFYSGYKAALASPYGQAWAGRKGTPSYDGFAAGWKAGVQAVRQGHPDVSLRDFGYRQVAAQGRMHLGFENQVFIPAQMDQKWWVAYRPALFQAYAALEQTAALNEREQFWTWVRIRGLLSPPNLAGVGHMNQYDRELVVEEALELRVAADHPPEAVESRTEAR
jgi:hypothetical protein